MKSFNGPTLIRKIKPYYLLWFEKSNQYLIIDDYLYELLQCFLSSKDFEDFKNSARSLGVESPSIEYLYKDLADFLKSASAQQSNTPGELSSFNYKPDDWVSKKKYVVENVIVEIRFQNAMIEQLIHPQISGFIIKDATIEPNLVIYVCEKHEKFCLFKNKKLIATFPKKDYHVLQGKFGMVLLCALHDNEEMDWIGTFHASTIAQNDKAVMLIGDSGSGKSTFTALLLANGFKVLADDISPMLFQDQKLYPYPSGISIKSGAFNALEAHIPNFKILPEHYINPSKGYVKFINPNTYQPIDFKQGYPCQTMVRVNYKNGHATTLKPLSTAKALQTLIPESWLAPTKKHAQAFMDWLHTVQFYQLTYSDSKEVIAKFSALFGD